MSFCPDDGWLVVSPRQPCGEAFLRSGMGEVSAVPDVVRAAESAALAHGDGIAWRWNDAGCRHDEVVGGVAKGTVAWGRGARAVADLPAHVEAFVAARVKAHDVAYSTRPMAKEVRGPATGPADTTHQQP
jgi:hypothetical protein